MTSQLQAFEEPALRLDARAVKDALYSRHPGHGGQFPGAWTCIEEWRNIDFLAFSAWSSAGRYSRIGYEVKVSRADLRNELLKPHKRAANVEWCNEFYFAVPRGLLDKDEIDWVEPEWEQDDWRGERCPGFAGRMCERIGRRRKKHHVRVPRPTTSGNAWERNYGDTIVCPTCKGKGVTTPSRVEREAPTCWVPRDVGLVVVGGRGSRMVKRAPRRTEVAALGRMEVGQLVRWVSMRPDPRHHPEVTP